MAWQSEAEAGSGTYVKGDAIYASRLGRKHLKSKDAQTAGGHAGVCLEIDILVLQGCAVEANCGDCEGRSKSRCDSCCWKGGVCQSCFGLAGCFCEFLRHR